MVKYSQGVFLAVMVKIVNTLGDVKIGRQGEVVYQRKYGEQIRRLAAPKRAIPSQVQLSHRELYKTALAWRSGLSLPNRRYLDGYCIANWIVDKYKIPLPWSRFALKLYLQAIKFVPDLELVVGDPIAGEQKDSADEVSGAGYGIGGVWWSCQTFTPSEAYRIGKVILKLRKNDTPGLVTVGIRLTDGAGKPTGEDLTSGTTDGNSIPEDAAYTWTEFDLTPYDLSDGIKYAIVVRAPTASGTWALLFEKTLDNTAYALGTWLNSPNSGVSWTPQNYDMNFQVWSADQEGEYTKEGVLHVKHPALMSVVQKREGLTVREYDTLSSLDDEYLTGQVGLDVELGDIILATALSGLEYRYQVC